MSTPATPTAEEITKVASEISTHKQRGFVAHLAAKQVPQEKIASLLSRYKEQDAKRSARYEHIAAGILGTAPAAA